MITFDNGKSIQIICDAAGNKLRKLTSEGIQTDYLGDIEYKNQTLESIAHSEGRVTTSVKQPGKMIYEYTIKDHLGNSRVMFSDLNEDGKLTISGENSEILQESHYYPFGMQMEGNWVPQVGVKNLYTYNSKELNEDLGLDWLDYGARWYDPAIGRWGQIDPLAESMASWSPYNYTFNNPIIFTDPTGMAPDNIGVDKKGNVVFDDGKDDGNLYLVDDNAGKIANVDDLEKNSTQLAEDFKWIGTDEQLVDYVKSQWKQAGNGLTSLIDVLEIGIKNDKNALGVSVFKGKKKHNGDIVEDAKPLGDVSLTIHYKKGEENDHLSNPYNTRNSLGHEKEHIKQGVQHYHQEKGYIKRYRSERELKAIKKQRTLPSWSKTTKIYKDAIKNYENKWKQ